MRHKTDPFSTHIRRSAFNYPITHVIFNRFNWDIICSSSFANICWRFSTKILPHEVYFIHHLPTFSAWKRSIEWRCRSSARFRVEIVRMNGGIFRDSFLPGGSHCSSFQHTSSLQRLWTHRWRSCHPEGEF